MNKLKALLIAGLLSLTSVSFATTVSYSDDWNAAASATFINQTFTVVDNDTLAGTINLENDGTAATFFGNLDGTQGGGATTTAWYDINLGSGVNDLVTFGFVQNNAQVDDLLFSFFKSDGSSLGAAYEDLMGNFTLTLAGNSSYKLKLAGSEGFTYNGSISAVPVPAAGILFASALFGAGALGRRKKKAQASVVGAFARAS